MDHGAARGAACGCDRVQRADADDPRRRRLGQARGQAAGRQRQRAREDAEPGCPWREREDLAVDGRQQRRRGDRRQRFARETGHEPAWRRDAADADAQADADAAADRHADAATDGDPA
jgi:hypothetical protein